MWRVILRGTLTREMILESSDPITRDSALGEISQDPGYNAVMMEGYGMRVCLKRGGEEEDATGNPLRSNSPGAILLLQTGDSSKIHSVFSILHSPLDKRRQQRKVYVPRTSSGGAGWRLRAVAKKKVYQRGSKPKTKLTKTRRRI